MLKGDEIIVRYYEIWIAISEDVSNSCLSIYKIS